MYSEEYGQDKDFVCLYMVIAAVGVEQLVYSK